MEDCSRFRLGGLWSEARVGRRTVILPPSSIDEYPWYVPRPTEPAVFSNGPVDIVLNDPVSNDGDTGNTSLVVVCGWFGLLGGDEASGSRVILPVSKSAPGRLF